MRRTFATVVAVACLVGSLTACRAEIRTSTGENNDKATGHHHPSGDEDSPDKNSPEHTQDVAPAPETETEQVDSSSGEPAPGGGTVVGRREGEFQEGYTGRENVIVNANTRLLSNGEDILLEQDHQLVNIPDNVPRLGIDCNHTEVVAFNVDNLVVTGSYNRLYVDTATKITFLGHYNEVKYIEKPKDVNDQGQQNSVEPE